MGAEEIEDEDDLIVMQEEANRYIRNGQLEEAIATLEIVTKDYPEFWSGHNNLAIAHFQSGNVDKALKLTEMILEKTLVIYMRFVIRLFFYIQLESINK